MGSKIMSDTYKAVVIGCGRIGAMNDADSGLPKPASHAAAFVGNARTELVALVDSDSAQLKRAAEYYRVATYADARECLQALHPDIVVLATMPNVHEELLALCFEFHVPAVICEKPMSDTVESAQRMLMTAEKSSSVVIINYQRRFFPLFKEARKKIAAGILGEIQQVTAQYTNGILNNGGHMVDALRFLLNDEALWVVGVENKKNTAAPFGANIDGLIGFANGTVATLQSLDNNAYSILEIRIFGTKGALNISQSGFRFDWAPAKDSVTFMGVKELDWWECPETQFERRSMVEATTAHVVDCLDKKVAPQSTAEDGYRTMQILESLSRSAAEGGKKITIK